MYSNALLQAESLSYKHNCVAMGNLAHESMEWAGQQSAIHSMRCGIGHPTPPRACQLSLK